MAEASIKVVESPKKPLYVVSMNHFINDGSTFLVASLFPAMEIAFGFSILKIGILVAVGYIINMIFQPLAGRLTQKYDPFRLLPAGISLIAVSMFIFAISQTFSIMLLSVVILRLGSSFFHPVGAFVVSQNYSGDNLDNAMGFESSFGNLGIVVAFLTSAPLYLSFGWAGPFIVYATLEIFTILVTIISFSGNFKIRHGSVEVQYDNTNHEVKNTDSSASVSGKRYVLGIPMFFILTGFLAGGGNAIFANYGNLLLYHSGTGYGISNDLMALWFGSAFIGAIVSGKIVAKLKRLNTLALSYLVAAIGSALFSIYSHSFVIASLSLLASGFALSITYPALYSELSVFAQRRLRSQGSSFGIIYSSQIAGAAFLGFLGGYLSSSFGLSFSFLVSAGLLMISAVAVVLWNNKFSKL